MDASPQAKPAPQAFEARGFSKNADRDPFVRAANEDDGYDPYLIDLLFENPCEADPWK